MKCVLVVVSVMAVFAAESPGLQQPPDGPFPEDPDATNTGQESKNNQNKPVLPGDRSITDESQNLQNGPLDQESSDGIDEQQSYDQHFIEEGNRIDAAQLRGKQQNKILKQIAKDLGNVKEEVQSIRDNQNNNTDIVNELKMKIQSMSSYQHNLTDVSKEIKVEMKSMSDHQQNLTDVSKEIKGELKSMSDHQQNLTSVLISKLDKLIFIQGLISFSNQRFLYLNDQKMNWTDADNHCRSLGMTLAEPRDPVGLRKHLMANYAPTADTWLGGRADGSVFKWIRGGQVLSSSSSLWWPGHPRGVTTNDCLGFLVTSWHASRQPSKPYHSAGCGDARYILCEKV